MLRIISLSAISLVFFLASCSPKTEPLLVVKNVKASSQLNASERPVDYSPFYVLDGNGATSWCEGEDKNGDTTVVTIELVKPIRFNRIWLQNGFKSAVTKTEKNATVPDEKTSMANYKSRAAARALKISAKLSGKPKGELLVKEIPDQPASVLQLTEPLLGDEITIQLADFHIEGRGYLKNDTCLTDIAFGLNDSKQGDVKFPIRFFYKEGIEKEWPDYYKLVLEEDYKYLSNNAYFAKCLSQPADCPGYSRILSGEVSVGHFLFTWLRPDLIAPTGAQVFLEVSSEDEGADTEFYRLRPLMHTVETGLYYDVLQPAGEEPAGRLAIRWVKNTDLKLHELANDPGKTKYHYLLEVSSEPFGQEPIIFNYILSKAK